MVASSLPRISPRTFMEFLHDFLLAPADQTDPFIVTGIPGVGKTSCIVQSCHSLGVPCFVLRPLQHESVEFTGLPSDDKSKPYCEWKPFNGLLPVDKDWNGMIFIDETHQCDSSQQKIIRSLLDREGVAGRRIPVGARFGLAGNRQQDRAGASRLLSIIESACWQCELLYSIEDWQNWAAANGVSQVTRSFATFQGSKFVSFDPAKSINPLPRTWHRLDRALAIRRSLDLDTTVGRAIVQGYVGPGMMAEYIAFHQHYHLLHNVVEKVFDAPASVPVDGLETSAQHALIGAVASYMKEHNGKLTATQANNVMVFAERCLNKTLQTLLVLHCDKAGSKQWKESTGRSEWTAENAELITSAMKGM